MQSEHTPDEQFLQLASQGKLQVPLFKKKPATHEMHLVELHCMQFAEQFWQDLVDVTKYPDLHVVQLVELVQTSQLVGHAIQLVFDLKYPAEQTHNPDDKTLPAAHVKHAEVEQDVQEKPQLMHEVPLMVNPVEQLHFPLTSDEFEVQFEQTPLLQVLHNTSQKIDVQIPEVLNKYPVLHEQFKPLATALGSLQTVQLVCVHTEQFVPHIYWHELPEYPGSQTHVPFWHTPYPLQASMHGMFSQRTFEAGQVTLP